MAYAALKRELVELDEEKRRIVEEAEALLEVLDSPGPDGANAVGLEGNLVDAEGFPRADIDIFEIRKHRHRLACLRTDRKALERKIEAKLLELHACMAAGGGVPDDIDGDDEPETEATLSSSSSSLSTSFTPSSSVAARAAAANSTGNDLAPLAIVDQVFDGSPAQIAGLQVGDRVLRFGSLVHDTGSATGPGPQLADFAAETSANMGRPVQVLVQRDAEQLLISLTPRQWQGRGALGCHLLPI